MFKFEQEMLDKFLHTLQFPLSKQGILDKAKNAILPPQLLSALQRLDDRQYDNAEDIESQLTTKAV